MVPVYSEKVVDKLLFEPIHKGANHLCILALRATPSMASWLITTYAERHLGNIAIELIVENTAENGINSVLHQGFKELQISSSMQLQRVFHAVTYISRLPQKRIIIYGLEMKCLFKQFPVHMILHRHLY